MLQELEPGVPPSPEINRHEAPGSPSDLQRLATALAALLAQYWMQHRQSEDAPEPRGAMEGR